MSNKFLILGLYVFQTLVGCALKATGLVSFSWISILAAPALVAVCYELIVRIVSGEFIFDITNLINKAAENKIYLVK